MRKRCDDRRRAGSPGAWRPRPSSARSCRSRGRRSARAGPSSTSPPTRARARGWRRSVGARGDGAPARRRCARRRASRDVEATRAGAPCGAERVLKSATLRRARPRSATRRAAKAPARPARGGDGSARRDASSAGSGRSRRSARSARTGPPRSSRSGPTGSTAPGRRSSWRAGPTPSRIIRSARSMRPPLARQAEALGLRALVGDQVGRREDREGQQHELAVVVRGQVVRDAAEDQRVGDAVHDRVEERAALARAVATPWRPRRRRGRGTRSAVSSTIASQKWPTAIVQAVATEKTRPENGEHVGREADARPTNDRSAALTVVHSTSSKSSVEHRSSGSRSCKSTEPLISTVGLKSGRGPCATSIPAIRAGPGSRRWWS